MGNIAKFSLSKDTRSTSVLHLKDVLLVKTNEHSDHHVSKYQRYHDNPVLQFFEFMRWKLNIALLFKPFTCLSQCNCHNHCHQFLYRLTISELLFFVIVIVLSIFPIMWFIDTLYDAPLVQWDSHQIIQTKANNIYLNSPGNMYGVPTSICFIITYMLSSRNTLWNLLFGLSFERAVTIHKYAARLSLILAFIHFWQYRNYAWFKGQCLTGSIMFICATLMAFTSIHIFRRKLWNIFIKLHWILSITFITCGLLHNAQHLSIALAFWVLDIFYRVYLSFGKPVQIMNVKLLPCNVIRIEFHKSRFTFDAGQYVFVCIPAISCTEWHPFSISSPPHDNESVMIHIRVLGDWTKKLYQFVSETRKLSTTSLNYGAQRRTFMNDLTMFVEGPYGKLQVPLHEYQSIVMISGGIGITPLQSIFNELVHNISVNSSPKYQNKKEEFHDFVQRIHFVWSVCEPSMVTEFGQRHWAGIQYKNTSKFNKHLMKDVDVEWFQQDSLQMEAKLPRFYSPDLLLVQQGSEMVQRTKVITQFHLSGVLDEETQQMYSERYKQLHFGRPNVKKIIRAAKREYYKTMRKMNKKQIKVEYETEGGCCVDDARGKGICILCCGPISMAKDVKKYASQYNVDCHIEIFEL